MHTSLQRTCRPPQPQRGSQRVSWKAPRRCGRAQRPPWQRIWRRAPLCPRRNPIPTHRPRTRLEGARIEVLYSTAILCSTTLRSLRRICTGHPRWLTSSRVCRASQDTAVRRGWMMRTCPTMKRSRIQGSCTKLWSSVANPGLKAHQSQWRTCQQKCMRTSNSRACMPHERISILPGQMTSRPTHLILAMSQSQPAYHRFLRTA
mmetsp:Transcript_106459/g.275250  ORF Transcript_106459/g.275250 Transcript_106459/m.275250 type:complete len:204 (-) Transcript_106459:385-996(-)